MNFRIFCALWIFQIINFISGLQRTECDESHLGRLGSGVIMSYNFPFDYRHNLSCNYRILMPSGHDTGGNSQICFTFNRFSLEASTEFCSFDYLKFHQNTDSFDPKYCGSGWWQFGRQPDALTTVWSRQFCWTVKDDYFDVVFTSDNNKNAAGFYATYRVYNSSQNPTSAPVVANTAPCEGSHWTCFDRQCIPRAAVCNGNPDCSDGSDETYMHARCGEQSVMTCDFSSSGGSDGYCGFTHDGWYRTTKSSSSYGPTGDHTNTTHGYYVYTDQHGLAAYLLSPEINLARNQPFCLSFWYYIYGSPPSAKLSVFVSRDQAYSRPEWERTVTIDTGWVRAQVSFNTHAQLQVIFAAHLNNGFSAVALDDLTVLPGTCLTGSDISCNFESGLCSWSAVNSLRHNNGELRCDILWSLSDGSTSEPAYDRSSVDGGGNFLVLGAPSGASAGSESGRGLLLSAPVSQTFGAQQCLRFAYYMYGRERSSCLLTVKVELANGALSADLWSQAADIRGSWQEAAVQLDVGEAFQVVLEGVVSASTSGRIALDKIQLDEGLCGEAGSGSCESGQYLCSHGQCIDGARKCDGQVDCGDGSDEGPAANCPVTTTTTTTSRSTTPGEVSCGSGEHACRENDGSTTCIAAEWVCDGVVDCTDNSDETSCSGPASSSTCAAGNFRCGDGTCLLPERLCDGHADCTDASDEGSRANCPATSPLPVGCYGEQFQCVTSLRCIAAALTCDDVTDCEDGSDESEKHAQCTAADVGSAGLSPGGAAGIAIALLLVAILVALFLLVFVRRRRQKKRSPDHSPPPSHAETVSTIAFGGDSMTRRMVNGVHPPAYADRQQNVATSGVRGSDLDEGPSGEEPPPPYDAVRKDGRQPHENHDNAHNDLLQQQNWQGTATRGSVGTLDRRAIRSMPVGHGNRRERAGSLPQARANGGSTTAAMDAVYVPRKYVPDPTVHPPSAGPFQRSQSLFPERTRPLPRPPGTYSIYPPRGGTCQGRIKLGTNALRSPRNYLNQSASGGVHSDYDTDSTLTNTDHIYETLNLPSDSDSRASGSRTGSLHALNRSSASVHAHRNESRDNLRLPSCSHSDVFEMDTALVDRSPQGNSLSPQHPYGPGYRPNSSLSGSSPTSQISNTTAHILYPSNRPNNQYRDRANILYKPNAQRQGNSTPNNRPISQNYDRQRSNGRRYSPNQNMSGQALSPNSMAVQYVRGNGQTSSAFSGRSSVQSPPLMHVATSQMQTQPTSEHQNLPLSPMASAQNCYHGSRTGYNNAANPRPNGNAAPLNFHNNPRLNMHSPLNNHTQSSVSSPMTSTSTIGNHNGFRPVTCSDSCELSPVWRGKDGDHSRNDSSLSGNRDVPTPDSQSNLIPSSNNSSFDQTPQRSVIFLSDMDTDHMNPTCV